MSPINVGFVGLSTSGWASFCLAPALLDPRLEGKYRLVAVSTSSPASAKATAELYSEETGNKVKAYHGSSRRIASDPNVDLVAVSVKAPLHKELALPAIEAGKDLFVEWPAGASLQETIEIAEAAKRKGVKTIVNLNARNSLVVRKVRELIESDSIGKVRSSTFIGTTYRESGLWVPWTSPAYKFALDKDNGATFLDIAVGHFIDAQSSVLGDFTSITATSSQQFPTATVMATEENFEPHEFFPRHETSLTPETVPNTSPDHYTISGPLTNGAHATIIFLSGANYGIGRRLMQWFIYGEKGVLRLQSVHPFMQIANPDIFVDYTNVTVEGAPGTSYKTPYAHTVSIQVGTWEAFSNGSGYATIDDAVKVKKTLQAIERSAKEGRTIFLD